MHGLAMGAFVKVKRQLGGVSIGILNYADSLNGLQIGILNYCGNNPKGLKLLPLINLHLR